MMSEIREPLITTTITDLTAQTLASSVGRVYLSKPMMANQEDAVRIRDAWQSVHLPTAGCSIPNTTRIVTKAGDGGPQTILVPTVNKTYAILAVDLVNNGANPMTVSLGYYDGTTFVTLNVITVAGTATGSFTTRNAYTFDSSVYPAFIVTSGTAGDAAVSMAYSELVQ